MIRISNYLIELPIVLKRNTHFERLAKLRHCTLPNLFVLIPPTINANFAEQ